MRSLGRYAFFICSFVLVPLLLAIPPQIGMPYPQKNRSCSPFCQMRFPAQRPFTLSYQRKMFGENENFQLKLNDRLFHLDNVNHFNNTQTDLPFYQYRFYDDHRYQMYGLLSSEGFVNDYYHYFIRDDDNFHHLGYYPSLTYDEEFDYFISVEKDGPRNQTSTYKLEGRKLVPTKEKSPPISKQTRTTTLSAPFHLLLTGNNPGPRPSKSRLTPNPNGVFFPKRKQYSVSFSVYFKTRVSQGSSFSPT